MISIGVLRRMVLVALVVSAGGVWAQEAAPPTEPAERVEADAPPALGVGEVVRTHQLTLWTMIKQGGAILWVLMGFGFVTLVMAIYFFLTIKPGREVPVNFVKRAQSQIRAGDLRGAYQMCEGREELLASVLRAGIRMSGHDRYVIQEAMESEGERGATALWQKISYLHNIGVIAPLLGGRLSPLIRQKTLS